MEDDPRIYKEVLTSNDSSFWHDFIQDEMDSVMSNYTRELVDPPKRSRSIGYKWVFRRKYHSDGTLKT